MNMWTIYFNSCIPFSSDHNNFSKLHDTLYKKARLDYIANLYRSLSVFN